MGKINWGRVFLCGLMTGAVWSVLLGIIVVLVGRDFVAAVLAAGRPAYFFPRTQAGANVFVVMINLLVGIWTMWLYAAIRPRYGPGPKTAAVAGFACWVFVALADAIWSSFGLIPPKVLVAPVAASLPAMIVAVVVGAWPYKE